MFRLLPRLPRQPLHPPSPVPLPPAWRPFSSAPTPDSHIDVASLLPSKRFYELSYARSSGPGGQNANKVNTKASLRLPLDDQPWMPGELRRRVAERNKGIVNSRGELQLTCQEHRTQRANREVCVKRLTALLLEAGVPEKERAMRDGETFVTEGGRQRRREDKRRRGDKKKNRGSKNDF
jgi:ribosome-associated protein